MRLLVLSGLPCTSCPPASCEGRAGPGRCPWGVAGLCLRTECLQLCLKRGNGVPVRCPVLLTSGAPSCPLPLSSVKSLRPLPCHSGLQATQPLAMLLRSSFPTLQHSLSIPCKESLSSPHLLWCQSPAGNESAPGVTMLWPLQVAVGRGAGVQSREGWGWPPWYPPWGFLVTTLPGLDSLSCRLLRSGPNCAFAPFLPREHWSPFTVLG